MTINTVFNRIGIDTQIKRRFDVIFYNNPDTITLERLTNKDAGNIFNEDIAENVIQWTLTVNINPDKQKLQDKDDKSSVDTLRLEVYSNPKNYPTNLALIERYDFVLYQGKRYKIKDLEDVALNGHTEIYQHFFIELIN